MTHCKRLKEKKKAQELEAVTLSTQAQLRGPDWMCRKLQNSQGNQTNQNIVITQLFSAQFI